MKSILLPLTAQIADENVTRVAGLLAFQFRATLNGLFIRSDPRSAIPFMGEGLTADMIQDLCNAADEEGKEQAQEAMDRYAKCMEQTGVRVADSGTRPDGANARWRVVAGQITDHVGRRARTADLAVCAKPSIDSGDSQEIFHDLIYRSGRPVLMVPEESSEAPGRHILVSWNGRAEGARAVGAALPLLWSAEKITLLQIGEGNPDRPSLEDVADYLHDHGVSSTILHRDNDGSPIGGQILDVAKEEAVDMVVVGAYSHSRWREMILGGVTRHLVTHSTLPIFMSH